jgi:uncharacterized membrane protein
MTIMTINKSSELLITVCENLQQIDARKKRNEKLKNIWLKAKKKAKEKAIDALWFLAVWGLFIVILSLTANIK